MNQSILPEANKEQTIKDMLPGDTGYTVPWAMYTDPKGMLWVNGNYLVYHNPGGTVQMLITRTEEGVIIDSATAAKEKYNPCYIGEFTPLPVSLK